MADRSILFSAPMIRALLAGRKTQTRRVLRNPEYFGCPTGDCPHTLQSECNASMAALAPRDTGFAPGDRLCVRETYFQRGHWEPVKGKLTGQGRQKCAFIPVDDVVAFDPPSDFRKGRHHRDPSTVAWHKRLGRFMPRRYSRLTLIVTDVRVDRLQSINEADAIAEGLHYKAWEVESGRDMEIIDGWSSDRFHAFKYNVGETAVEGYQILWDSINGAGAWDKNPWVVAVSFDVIRGNIDTQPFASSLPSASLREPSA